MSYIDVTGKTEDEALRKGLEQLGMDRDDVSVSILERAKSGFFRHRRDPRPYSHHLWPGGRPVAEEPVAAPRIIPEKPAEKPAEKIVQPKPAQPRQPRQEKPRQERPQPEKRPEAAAPAAPQVDLPECDDDNAKRIIALRVRPAGAHGQRRPGEGLRGGEGPL